MSWWFMIEEERVDEGERNDEGLCRWGYKRGAGVH